MLGYIIEFEERGSKSRVGRRLNVSTISLVLYSLFYAVWISKINIRFSSYYLLTHSDQLVRTTTSLFLPNVDIKLFYSSHGVMDIYRLEDDLQEMQGDFMNIKNFTIVI